MCRNKTKNKVHLFIDAGVFFPPMYCVVNIIVTVMNNSGSVQWRIVVCFLFKIRYITFGN